MSGTNGNELEKTITPNPKTRVLRILRIGTLLIVVCSVFLLVASHQTGRIFIQELLSVFGGKGERRANDRFRQRLEVLNLPAENLNLKIVVKKRERRLLLQHGDIILAAYPIGLGKQPLGHKSQIDDQRTPEGEYYVCYKKERSRYHLFLGISYPSPNDASVALARGQITATEAESILDAWMNKERPPWNTAIGGAIGIHGFGAEADWTEGTIAMHNAHVEEIFWNVPVGTPVLIEP